MGTECFAHPLQGGPAIDRALAAAAIVDQSDECGLFTEIGVGQLQPYTRRPSRLTENAAAPTRRALMPRTWRNWEIFVWLGRASPSTSCAIRLLCLVPPILGLKKRFCFSPSKRRKSRSLGSSMFLCFTSDDVVSSGHRSTETAMKTLIMRSRRPVSSHGHRASCQRSRLEELLRAAGPLVRRRQLNPSRPKARGAR